LGSVVSDVKFWSHALVDQSTACATESEADKRDETDEKATEKVVRGLGQCVIPFLGLCALGALGLA
jgi:hypothetical protein